MKLSLILITWFIISIPAGILLGRFCAAGNGFLADSAQSQEQGSRPKAQGTRLARSRQLLLRRESKPQNRRIRRRRIRYCPSDSPPCGRVPSFDIQIMKQTEFTPSWTANVRQNITSGNTIQL